MLAIMRPIIVRGQEMLANFSDYRDHDAYTGIGM